MLAIEVGDAAVAVARLRRAGIAAPDVSITERAAETGQARFALAMPPDLPEGRVLLVRHLTRDLLWRPETVVHPNGALALTETIYAVDRPAETMTRFSRLTGRPAVPDPLGGYQIPLGRGRIHILSRSTALELFPGAPSEGPSLIGVTIAGMEQRVVHAGGIAIRFVPSAC